MIGGIQMMIILVMGVLRIDFSQFSLHDVKFTEMIIFLLLSQLFNLILFLEFLLIKVFLG